MLVSLAIVPSLWSKSLLYFPSFRPPETRGWEVFLFSQCTHVKLPSGISSSTGHNGCEEVAMTGSLGDLWIRLYTQHVHYKFLPRTPVLSLMWDITHPSLFSLLYLHFDIPSERSCCLKFTKRLLFFLAACNISL